MPFSSNSTPPAIDAENAPAALSALRTSWQKTGGKSGPALVVVGAFAELDRPFASVIGLHPRAMESVLTSVVQSSKQSPTVFRPCGGHTVGLTIAAR
jgi:hypothetical protein